MLALSGLRDGVDAIVYPGSLMVARLKIWWQSWPALRIQTCACFRKSCDCAIANTRRSAGDLMPRLKAWACRAHDQASARNEGNQSGPHDRQDNRKIEDVHFASH